MMTSEELEIENVNRIANDKMHRETTAGYIISRLPKEEQRLEPTDKAKMCSRYLMGRARNEIMLSCVQAMESYKRSERTKQRCSQHAQRSIHERRQYDKDLHQCSKDRLVKAQELCSQLWRDITDHKVDNGSKESIVTQKVEDKVTKESEMQTETTIEQ